MTETTTPPVDRLSRVEPMTNEEREALIARARETRCTACDYSCNDTEHRTIDALLSALDETNKDGSVRTKRVLHSPFSATLKMGCWSLPTAM